MPGSNMVSSKRKMKYLELCSERDHGKQVLSNETKISVGKKTTGR